jgi:hypothetical protein
MSLTFSDEFNDGAYDWRKWPVSYGGGTGNGGAHRWENSQVSEWGGNLVVTNAFDGSWKTGGIATTPNQWNPGFAQTYGRFEARARVEDGQGTGGVILLWPADNGWPPEMDLMETPHDRAAVFNHAPDGRVDGGAQWDLRSSDWHVYAVDWSANRLAYSIDGRTVWETTDASKIPDEPMVFGLQGFVERSGSTWYGGAPTSTASTSMYVDYVRAYSSPSPPPSTSPSPGPTPAPAPAPSAPSSGVTSDGTAGDDNLRGGAGPDTLSGGAGSDDLQSFAGNDRLSGGRGDDGLTLGDGADRVVFARGDGSDWVVDFRPGTDKLELSGFAASEVTTRGASYWGMSGTDVLLPGGEKLFLQGVSSLQGGDIVYSNQSAAPAPAPTPAPSPTPAAGGVSRTGGSGADELRGGAGNDTLSGEAGSDDLQGFGGNDRLAGGRGHDGLTLGAGADTVAFARGDADDWVVDFTPGSDKLLITGYTASAVAQRGATYWGSSGLDLVMSGGDRIFLQGVSSLQSGDLVFA